MKTIEQDKLQMVILFGFLSLLVLLEIQRKIITEIIEKVSIFHISIIIVIFVVQIY